MGSTQVAARGSLVKLDLGQKSGFTKCRLSLSKSSLCIGLSQRGSKDCLQFKSLRFLGLPESFQKLSGRFSSKKPLQYSLLQARPSSAKRLALASNSGPLTKVIQQRAKAFERISEREFIAGTNSACLRVRGKRRATVCTRAARDQWTLDQSPYDTLGVQGDAPEDDIKSSYRNLVKRYHPDVYQDSEDGEPAGARFIRIQAAYELLMDREARGNYDRDHKRNPFMASEAWQAYVQRKKKAFEQRGDVAASAWAEVQRHEMQVKARQMAKQKMDPEEERRIVAKEMQIKAELFDKTSKRHMLVLKKRDLAKKRAGEDERKLLVQKLLLEEGFELEDEE